MTAHSGIASARGRPELPAYFARTLGDSVRAWREYRHLTPTKLARQADIPKQLISEIERDKTRQTGYENLIRIAAALEVSPLLLLVRATPSEAEKWLPSLMGSSTHRDEIQALGAFGSPIGLGDEEDDLLRFAQSLASIMAEYDLPLEARLHAEALIRESARAILKVVADEIADRNR